MKLEQSFEVTAPLDRVWETLIDVERVAPCLPGAEVTGRNDDGTFDGTFRVKIGPTAAAYVGTLAMESVDADDHVATIDAQGTDRRGQGGARATIVSTVTAVDDATTRVEVVTDYSITGRLARFGRGGMIEEVANRLLSEFAGSLQTMLVAGGLEAVDAAELTGAETVPEAEPAPRRRKPGPAAAAAAAVEAAAAAAAAEAAAEAEGARAAEAAESAGAAATEAAKAKAGESAPAPEPEPVPITEAAASAELAAIVPEADPEADPVPDPEGEAEMEEVAEAETVAEPEPEPVAEPEPADEAPFPGATPAPPVPAVEPLDAGALAGGAVWSRVKENPAPFVALVLGFLFALRVFRRRS